MILHALCGSSYNEQNTDAYSKSTTVHCMGTNILVDSLSNRASLCQLSVCSRHRNGAYLVQRSHVCDAGSGSSHSSWTVWAWGEASDMGIMHCGSCWSGITGARRCSTWDRRCVEPAQRPLLWSTGVTPASMSLSACGTACVKAAAASLWALPQSLH